MAKIDLFSDRQHMQKNWFEIFRYRDSYIKDIELHHHDFYEIYLFLNGNVTYSIESRNYVLQPGDLLLIGPMELHRPVITPAKNAYERIVLWLDANFVARLSTKDTNLKRCFDTQNTFYTNLLRPNDEHKLIITQLMNKLLYESSTPSYGSDLICYAELLNLLVTLNRISFCEKMSLPQTSKSSVLISNVLKYINENYSSDLSLEGIASKFFISKYYLSHEFNALVNTSVYRYIIQKRLIMAKQMLNQGTPPTTVYEKCGFGDYANFYRAFKAEYQISPKEYAKQQDS